MQSHLIPLRTNSVRNPTYNSKTPANHRIQPSCGGSVFDNGIPFPQPADAGRYLATAVNNSTSAMTLHKFALCDRCLDQYRSLTHDPMCQPKANAIPFGTVYWPDEHPFINGRFGPLANHLNEATLHGPCYFTVAHLTAARYGIWSTGAVESEFRDFWNIVRNAIPNWPGFNRERLIDLPYGQKLALPPKFQRLAGLTAHCPYCKNELPSALSRQCLKCHKNWHSSSEKTK